MNVKDRAKITIKNYQQKERDPINSKMFFTIGLVCAFIWIVQIPAGAEGFAIRNPAAPLWYEYGDSDALTEILSLIQKDAIERTKGKYFDNLIFFFKKSCI